MAHPNGQHNQFNEQNIFNILNGPYPAEYYVALVKELSHSFETCCIGQQRMGNEQQLLRVDPVGFKLNMLREQLGVLGNERQIVEEIAGGFQHLLLLGKLPVNMKIKRYRAGFNSLVKYYERLNLTPELVFNNFGRTVADAKLTLGVASRVLKGYIKDEFKINQWPVGRAGNKLLVQISKPNNLYEHAFDLNPNDNMAALNNKLVSWLGVAEGVNLGLGYYVEGNLFVPVIEEDDWIACKMYFQGEDRVSLTLHI